MTAVGATQVAQGSAVMADTAPVETSQVRLKRGAKKPARHWKVAVHLLLARPVVEMMLVLATAWAGHGHAVHAPEFAGAHVPAAHCVQELEPPGAKVPALQLEHDVEPVASVNVPAGHGVQEPAAAPEKKPAGHSEHELAPAEANEPAPQGAQEPAAADRDAE
jgi:hypothetical protein